MPTRIYHRLSAIERFCKYLSISETGCWEWNGCCGKDGYGQFWDGKRLVKAHRFSYEYFNGITIPDGLESDHLCRNRKCVNPNHIEPVTRSENIRRGVRVPNQNLGARQKAKTHCPKGHPYDNINTYLTPTGKRDCRICRCEASRRCEANRRWRVRN